MQAPQAIETPKTPGPTVGGFADHHDREPLFVAIAYTAVDGFVFGQGRQAAQEEDFDLATAQKIADWLGVTPTSIIDAEGVGKDALAAQIAAVLQSVQKQKPRTRDLCENIDRFEKVDEILSRSRTPRQTWLFELPLMPDECIRKCRENRCNDQLV